MIRRIDQNGIISTLLGFNDLTSARPLSCDAVMDISQVRPPRPLPLHQQQGTSPPSLLSTPPRRCLAASFPQLRVSCVWLLRFPTAFWVRVLTGSAFVNWLQTRSSGSQEAVINSARGRRRLVGGLDDRCPSWLVAYIQFIWPSAYVYFPCMGSIYICLNISAAASEDGWFFFFLFSFGRGTKSLLWRDTHLCCRAEKKIIQLKVLVSCTPSEAAKFLLFKHVWVRSIG